MELTKLHVDVGAFRNCLVFDDKAATGIFTDRLLALIKYQYLSRNDRKSWHGTDLGLIEALFISRYGAASSCIWGNCKKYDVDIIITDQLGENGELQKYYTKTLQGSLAASDEELVIAVGRDDVLLGSF
jgi:hypothetical protein